MKPPPSETQTIDEVAEAFRRRVAADYASRRPALRGEHAKAHGVARATFTVRDDIPSHLQHGLFATPRSYEAIIRFSGGSDTPIADTRPDSHGMAVKVLGVDGGRELDFVLLNSPAFFIRTPEDYLPLLPTQEPGATAAQRAAAMVCWVLGAGLGRPRLREVRRLVALKAKLVVNPLDIRYWSQTPYRLGQKEIVKYSATPVTRDRPPAWIRLLEELLRNRITLQPKAADYDILQREMNKALTGQARWFTFSVQLHRGDEKTMPIEDPTVVWSETSSAFVPVATIAIAPQDVGAQHLRNHVERLSFNPANTLAAHEPVGRINAMRAEVYRVVAGKRAAMNARPQRASTGDND